MKMIKVEISYSFSSRINRQSTKVLLLPLRTKTPIVWIWCQTSCVSKLIGTKCPSNIGTVVKFMNTNKNTQKIANNIVKNFLVRTHDAFIAWPWPSFNCSLFSFYFQLISFPIFHCSMVAFGIFSQKVFKTNLNFRYQQIKIRQNKGT